MHARIMLTVGRRMGRGWGGVEMIAVTPSMMIAGRGGGGYHDSGGWDGGWGERGR